MENKKTFTGKIGFVMAAAGSAVGLGNLWRFPYLAAKYGGGTFLLIYLILAVTFGFTLMVTEIAIGRKTGRSVITAYGAVSKKFSFLGPLVFLVPAIILPYYCVVGGWVLKYFTGYLIGEDAAMTDSGFFASFIGKPMEPMIYTAVFLGATGLIIALGIEKGIENFSKVLMPILIALSIIIAIYVCTLPGSGAGIIYYFKPDLTQITPQTVVAATGQLFYSLSLGMAIMITYGSYMKKEDGIESAARQIEIFDTLVAFLAGLIIVPAVYAFSNGDKSQLSQGAGLMFVTLPKIFETLPIGRLIGILFFLLVIFAALTSSISLLEALVAVVLERTKLSRPKATLIVTLLAMLIAVPSVLGYNLWSGIRIAGFAFLDFFDFISNSLLMPFVEFLTCLIIGWAVGPKVIEDEVEFDNQPFRAKKMYRLMVRFAAPILLLVILVSSVLNALGIITI
jgi:NSS family neurotransmitter:Na+ symporter